MNDLLSEVWCKRCQNTRVVTVPGAYGDQQVSCPECRPEESPLAKRETLENARRKRDAAVEDVSEHANPEAREAAWGVLVQLLREQHEVTGDDLMDALREAGVRLVEPRVTGALFMRAKGKGYIEDSGKWQPSRRRHAAKQTVWVSTLWEGKSGG